MTIDITDYEPRPADDLVAKRHPVVRGDWRTQMRLAGEVWKNHSPRMTSFSRRNTYYCHQLGCNFDELPHG